MEASAFALWLDSALASFDYGVLRAVHAVQQSGLDAVLGPLARLLALLGKGGAGLILLGLALLLWRRTRRYGVGVLVSLAVCGLLVNVLLKPWVARPRPYADALSPLHRWWLEAGASLESDYSFPSGHSAAAMAAMTALFWLGERRCRAAAFLFAAAMALSRLYLVVHYPTDVLAGLLAGFLSGAAGVWLSRRLWDGPLRRIPGF
ncbi:MAG: phosphatase PAP2 family protein [Oscillospiraceae bacterium]|nr:phosphatase PAP2 family protein [Oscillospiraceae bacterium]